MRMWQEIIYTEQLLSIKKQNRLAWRELASEFPPFSEQRLKTALVALLRQDDFYPNGVTIMPQEYRELCKNSLYITNVYYKNAAERLVTSVKLHRAPIRLLWRVEQSGRHAQSIVPDDVPAAVPAAVIARLYYLLEYWLSRPQDTIAARATPLARVKTWA